MICPPMSVLVFKHMRRFQSLLLLVILIFWGSVVFSQGGRALSVGDIEFLLKEGVSQGRVAELIKERGVSFDALTEEIREKLKKAGADALVMVAVNGAVSEVARKKLEEERRRVEEETQREADRRRAEQARRKVEEDRRREEEERRRAEEIRRGLYQDAERFYRGKTVRFVVGFAPGGGFDVYTRLIAGHIGKHIPGNPSTVVENMPGGGSLIAANYLYNSVNADGLTIGSVAGGLILQQLLGRTGITFDSRKFQWVGVPSKENNVCALTRASGLTSLDKWMASNRPVKLGGTAAGATTDDIPKLLRASLGLPIELVSGYKGTAGIRAAAERGEIAGGCWAWESIRQTWRTGLESGEVNLVLQATSNPHPELAKIPSAVNFARTSEARTLIEIGIHDATAITRPYALPPGSPRDRLRVLRTAFQSTIRDSAFLAEAQRIHLPIDAMTGEEVEEIVLRLFRSETSHLARLKEVLLH